MATENFSDVLVRAAKAVGSLLGVAKLLGVEPRQVYFWIADIDLPSDERRKELEGRLPSVPPASLR
jgi:hypothetical protein